MAFIDWRDLDLTTGHPTIDAQHQKLVEMINELYNEFLEMEDNSKPSVFKNSVLATQEHIDYFFMEEEKIMNALEYPDRYDHIDKHDEFRRDLAELFEKVTDVKNPNVKFLSKKLLLLLRGLLLDHITKEDKRFVVSCARIAKSKYQ